MNDIDIEEWYCGDCGCWMDGEICDLCKDDESLDLMKTDRRWNGKTFWQSHTDTTQVELPSERLINGIMDGED